MGEAREFELGNVTLRRRAGELSPGDVVRFSGELYTARDAAHQRFRECLRRGEPLPIPLSGSIIYYAGPTETPPGLPIGSCGPTTASRMDVFTPELMERGLFASVGKGDRSPAVYDAITRAGGLYLCAVGGAGALYAGCVRECRVVAYADLGCESVKRLIVEDMPLIVGITPDGRSLFRGVRHADFPESADGAPQQGGKQADSPKNTGEVASKSGRTSARENERAAAREGKRPVTPEGAARV